MKIQALGKYCFYSLLCSQDNVHIPFVNWSKKHSLALDKRIANNKATDIILFYFNNRDKILFNILKSIHDIFVFITRFILPESLYEIIFNTNELAYILTWPSEII